MKAVFSDTVVHITFEIRFCRGRSLLCVNRYSFRIFSDEDSIMLIRIFIDKSVLYKTIENLTVDQSFVYQITVHPSHICMRFG